jgi:type II secretory pathway pseudopilin PulG
MNIPFCRTHRIAFTLVELLVAIGVLSIMIVFLGAIVTSVSTVSAGARQNAENSSSARAILDLMSRELEAGVSRPDLNQTNWITVNDAGSTLMFYSRNTGSATATASPPTSGTFRPLSYVEYTWSQGGTNAYLGRGDQAVLWSDTPLTSIPLGFPGAVRTGPATSNVLDGVVAFQVAFLQQDGTLSAGYSGTNTIAVALSLALVDPDSLRLLLNSGKRQALSQLLTQASAGSITGTEISNGSATTPKMDWENAINSPEGIGAYPQQLKTGLRFFERTVDLPKPIL